jgi:hypothetical protein
VVFLFLTVPNFGGYYKTSLSPSESNLTQINKVVKFGNSEKTKNHALAKKHTKINIKQALKLIPKIKSTPTKQLLQEIKNQKQIFNYEGENGLMTFGFNIIMYSLICGVGFFIIGLLAELTGKDRGLGFFIIGLGGGVFGAMIGAGIWLLGAIVSLMS